VYSDTGDPVDVLRTFQQQLMYGRPLNLMSADTTIDGETVQISVDQFRLLSTTFDKLLQIHDKGCDFRTPLEVTFYNEKAVDLGGKYCLFIPVPFFPQE